MIFFPTLPYGLVSCTISPMSSNNNRDGSLRTVSCLDRAEEAARALRFNPVVVAISERILDSIFKMAGDKPFNGIHLRYVLLINVEHDGLYYFWTYILLLDLNYSRSCLRHY